MKRAAPEHYSSAKLQDLKADFQSIGQELRSQDALAYRPSNDRRDGTFRRIRVEVEDRRYSVGASFEKLG